MRAPTAQHRAAACGVLLRMSLLPPGLGAPAAPTRASAAQAISILRTGGGDVNVNAAAAGNRHSAGSWRKASLPPPPQPAASVAALQALSDIHRRVSARALHVARTHDDDLYAAQQELDRTHEALADLRANVGAIARGDSMRMRMATSTAAALAGSPGRNLSLANEELEETATAAAGDDESSSEEECGDPAQQQPPLLPPHTGEKETTQALSAVVPGELVVSVRRATQLKELHYLSGMHPFCTCTVRAAGVCRASCTHAPPPPGGHSCRGSHVSVDGCADPITYSGGQGRGKRLMPVVCPLRRSPSMLLCRAAQIRWVRITSARAHETGVAPIRCGTNRYTSTSARRTWYQ